MADNGHDLSLMMRLSAEILTVGNELLKGSTVNTNAAFLGRRLTDLGYEVIYQSSCRDNLDEIIAGLEQASRRSHVTLVTGGLGPTPDDLTRDAISQFLDAPLTLSPRQWNFIQNYYRKRKTKIPSIVKKEAMFPEGAIPLFNQFGIALGFSCERNGRLVIVLPGVPDELEKMFEAQVEPVLKAKLPREQSSRFRLVVKTIGLPEPEVMRLLGKDFFDDPFDFGIYPEAGEVAVRIYAEKKAILQRLTAKVKSRIPVRHLYALREISVVQALMAELCRRGETIAAAESCTGGQLSAELTRYPGSSRIFRGSVVAYHKDIKKWLGIDPAEIRKFGAVSESTARAMSISVRRALDADYGLAVTGVAGPSKDENKPVGRVYLALSGKGFCQSWEENFWGDRMQIQKKSVKKALEYLWRHLMKSR